MANYITEILQELPLQNWKAVKPPGWCSRSYTIDNMHFVQRVRRWITFKH